MQYDAEHMGRLSDCLVIKSNATRCASAMQLDDQVNAITQQSWIDRPLQQLRPLRHHEQPGHEHPAGYGTGTGGLLD